MQPHVLSLAVETHFKHNRLALQMTAALFSSGLWTAFTFNPMGCTVNAVMKVQTRLMRLHAKISCDLTSIMVVRAGSRATDSVRRVMHPV